MKTQQIINRIKEGEFLTLSTLTHSQLIEMGWHFEENEAHENFELSYHNGEFRLCAVANSNDTYEVESGTEKLGGMEGVAELIENGGATFDQRFVAEYGVVNLK